MNRDDKLEAFEVVISHLTQAMDQLSIAEQKAAAIDHKLHIKYRIKNTGEDIGEIQVAMSAIRTERKGKNA